MFHLGNKIALVTGGGSGIGSAIALLFAKKGAAVCILDIDEQGGTSVANQILAQNGQGFFLNCNVAKQEEVDQAVHTIVSKYSSIDILINNAGVAHIGTAETTKEEDFERLLNVNVKGVYNCLHAVLPIMKMKGGVIVNLASAAASVGLSERFAYTATKAAVVGMTLSVAEDYLYQNIRCNSVSPGRVDTPYVDGY